MSFAFWPVYLHVSHAGSTDLPFIVFPTTQLFYTTLQIFHKTPRVLNCFLAPYISLGYVFRIPVSLDNPVASHTKLWKCCQVHLLSRILTTSAVETHERYRSHAHLPSFESILSLIHLHIHPTCNLSRFYEYNYLLHGPSTSHLFLRH